MSQTVRVKWDDTANRLTAYCSDDTGETELGPVKWDDTNNRLELNCASTDFQAKWNDSTNVLESQAVDDGCCVTGPDCACCGKEGVSPPNTVYVDFSGISDCGLTTPPCTDFNDGTYACDFYDCDEVFGYKRCTYKYVNDGFDMMVFLLQTDASTCFCSVVARTNTYECFRDDSAYYEYDADDGCCVWPRNVTNQHGSGDCGLPPPFKVGGYGGTASINIS